jgi:hypothetical protein
VCGAGGEHGRGVHLDGSFGGWRSGSCGLAEARVLWGPCSISRSALLAGCSPAWAPATAPKANRGSAWAGLGLCSTAWDGDAWGRPTGLATVQTQAVLRPKRSDDNR